MSGGQGNWNRATAPHAVAVRVTPAVAILASSIAAATVLETATPHHFVSGDTVRIGDHAGSTPALDGLQVVTVIDATHVSVPVAVTIAGTGGTVTRVLAAEPLTLDEAKLRAGLDWVAGDARDALMRGFIAAARAKLEQDTGISLLLKTFDVFFDAVPADHTPIALPWRPVPWLTSFASVDRAGVPQVLDAGSYTLDSSSEAPRAARVALAGGVWPTDLRLFQPWVLRIVAGWPSVALIPEPLLQAVGLLTVHYATLGRDLASVDAAVELPQGYTDLISGYVPVVVA